MTSEPFGNDSSVKILEWLSIYKKLSFKKPSLLNEQERSQLKELEGKLARFVAKQPGDTFEPKRENLRVDASYEVHFKTKSDFKKAYVSNISGGGLYIESKQIPEMGSQIELDMKIDSESPPIHLKGIVAWTNPLRLRAVPQGFGIRFVDLNDADRETIQRAVHIAIDQTLKKKS